MTEPSRCGGCGCWLDAAAWGCPVCRVLADRAAAVTALEEAHTAAQGRARRGALEAALPGTGYQHRPNAA